ncbi:hypothetical protein AVEN_115200-1 [Araneus ventricosus]|uniref:Uncharacterized protein n=1 Tax=Araneus ventricosus TaxID=182803 RepID=A0A4Y1ZXN0_ARAVE|nr:hypothetical protein AVEN_115200-1 [Araneus ventricosus]
MGGRVVRFRILGRRVPVSEPNSTEDPPRMGSCYGCMLNHTVVAKRPPVGVVRKFGEGLPARVSPRHLTAVKNDEVRPKIDLVFFQKGTLIR